MSSSLALSSRLARLCLLVAALSCSTFPWALLGAAPAAVAQPRTTFTNSVGALPANVLPSAKPVAPANLGETQEIEIPLRMRDYPKLLERIGRGEVLSAVDFEKDHLPFPRDYTMVERWLRDEGFEITQTDPNRLSIFARGTLAQIQHALQVQMYKVTVRGRVFNAAQTHPSLPNDIAVPVLGINGLQPFRQAHKHLLQPSPAIANKPPYQVKEIMGAYGGSNLGVTGSGQTIAILIDSVPRDTDLTSFWSKNGIAQTLSNITKIAVNGSLPTDSDGEATLDVEWSSSAAPAAKVRVYATGELSFTDIDKGLQRIISDLPSQPTLHQLSISLGLGETYLLSSSEMQTEAQYFATLASKGVSVFVASGDAGSNPDDTGHNDASDPGPLQVEYESSDPSVTGVGGTNLILNASTGAVSSETAWSASGGGVSRYFTRPSWQTGTGVPAGTKRFVPDVALVASDTTAAYLYFEGQATGVAGTSWSSPTWAGFAALINEARAKHSLASMGLMNPLIYPLIGTANFRDITAGSNGSYSAGTGYDRITGVGVPNLAVLLTTLGGTSTGAPTISGFSPASGAPGASVTITGTNLDRATDVQFGGVSATFTATSSTSITATVPAAAKTGVISVVTSTATVASTATFTVVAATVANDDFSAAKAITGTSGTSSGSNVGATKETSEPDHAGNAGGASVWFKWTAPSAGIYTFDTSGSSFDTLLGVYTGSSVAALTEVASNDDAGTGVTSSVSFTATASTSYFLAVDGHNGQTGTYALNWAKNTTAPTINNFVPASGAAGTVVAINGANLDGVTAVTFSGVPATFTAISTTQISATVPATATTGVISVTTGTGSVSSAAVFSVTNPPANDNFASAQSLPDASGTVTGTNVGATKETGEPNHAGGTGGHSVWYTWTAPETKAVTFNTFGSSFDTLLAIYTGSAVNALTQVAADDDAGAGFNSAVTFQATAGVTYRTAVDGSGGVVGNLVLNWNSNIAMPVISNFTPTSGSTGTMVVITGTSLGSTTSVTFNGTAATFSINSETQLTATVPAGATTGTIFISNPVGTAMSASPFTVAPASSNDNFANATSIPALGTYTGSNAGATKEPNEPDHAGNSGGASVWWTWTAPSTTTYTITTLGSTFDTELAVYTGTALNALTAVASNDDDPSGGHTSFVTLNAVAGTVYHIAIDGFNGATGDILLSVLADGSGTIFSTAFEAAEGYSTTAPTLANQKGWLGQGLGSNGIVSGYFDGMGQQAFLGFGTSSRNGGSSYVWQPLNYTPAAGDIVTFQVVMQIVDSTNRRYDDFEWQVYNQAGTMLFALDFDNATLGVGYVLDSSNSVHSTGFQFGNDSQYTLLVTMDFTKNKWSASLDGNDVVTNQPITTKGAALNLGDVDANWNIAGRGAGNNYLLFDNFSVRNTGNSAPKILLQPQAQSVNQGGTVSLRTVATGTQPISYQWQKDTQNIDGATDPTLTLDNVQPGDAGSYVAVITNPAGTIKTAAALLKVNAIAAPNLQPYQPHDWSDRLVVSGQAGAMKDDAAFVAGETLYAGFGLTNSGTVQAPSGFHSALYLDGVLQTTSTQASPLDPGTAVSQTGIAIGTLTAGSHELKLVIDSDNAVAESNEGDNSYLKTIKVVAATNYAVITTSVSPGAGGAVSGGGAYAKNARVTLLATPNADYSFIGWTDKGVVVSTAETYAFTASVSRTLVAHFELTADLPTIAIASALAAVPTVHTTLALSGTATGTAGLAKVTWKNNQGGAGTATGTTSWNIAAIPLKAGPVNVITVTATDVNGGRASATYSMTRDSTGSLHGRYAGLLTVGGATPSYAGEAIVAVSVSGAMSADVRFFGHRSVMNGAFDANGTFTRTIKRAGLPNLTVSFTLTLAPGAATTIVGTVTDGTTQAALNGVLPDYLLSTHRWPNAGRYTMLLERNEADTTAPRGQGYGLMTVSTTGLVSVAGRLADGSVYSHAGYIAAGNTSTYYMSLYRGLGYIAGPMTFESSAAGDLTGVADWSRPTSTTLYPAGFQTRLTLHGSRYKAPPASAAVLAAGNRTTTLGDGDLGATVLSKTLSLGVNNAFTVTPADTDKLKLSVVRATGFLTGSFFDSASNKTLPVLGVVLQTPDTAGGYFLAPSGSGDLEIGAAPQVAVSVTPAK